MPAVRAAAAAVGASPPSSPAPLRRLSAAGRERLRRRRRRRQAAARQGARMLEGYSTQAAAFAWKTGTDSYDDEADEGIEGEAEGGGSSSSSGVRVRGGTGSSAQRAIDAPPVQVPVLAGLLRLTDDHPCV